MPLQFNTLLAYLGHHFVLYTYCDIMGWRKMLCFYTQAIIFALNAGADYQPAGPLWLAGGVKSYRTALTKDIDTFEKFTVSAIQISIH